MRQKIGIALAALVLFGVAITSAAKAQILGTAEDFGVLAGSTVTNTGSSVINGSVGVFPGLAVVGFPPGIVNAPGVIHAGDAAAQQAQIDLTKAYVALQALPADVVLTGKDLGGMTLSPATYFFASSAQLTGVLTLNGQGNTASQWVFQIGSTLTTASNSAVLLINGANGNNVYWAVGSSATLGTNSVFAGNILAQESITLNTGATITCGRALAQTGAVTLDSNTITLCVPGAGGGSDTTQNDLFGEGVSGAQQTALGASKLFGSAIMREAAFWRDEPQTLMGRRSIKDDDVPDAMTGGYQSWRAWATGFGEVSRFNGDAATGSADLRTHTAGLAAGFDYQFDRTALVGIAVGYTSSGFSVDQRVTDGTVEGAHAGIYGMRRFGSLYLSGVAEYAHFWNETDRFIDFVVDTRAEGKFTSDLFSARVEAGWKRYVGGLGVTPFAGLAVSHLRSDGFVEDSTGILGLTFGSNSVTSLESSLGLQLDTRIALDGGRVLTPFARVAWVHEFNPDRSVNAFMTLSPAAMFSPEGASAASDAARVSAGLKLDVNERMGLFALFDGEFSDHSHSYAGTAGVKIRW